MSVLGWVCSGAARMTNDPVQYQDFRSGLTFAEVREELSQEQRSVRDTGCYMYVTRSTVLGRWRQHKLSAYEHYLALVGGS